MNDIDKFLHELESHPSGAFRPNPEFAEFRHPPTGDTILHVAARNRAEQAIVFLLQDPIWKALVNTKNKFGLTALHVLCVNSKAALEKDDENRLKNILQMFLDNDANINEQDEDGWTPLHWAVSSGCLVLVNLILGTNNVDVNKGTFLQGATPLHIAVDGASVEIMKALIDKKARLDITTHSGESILHWALAAAKYLHGGRDNRYDENNEGGGASTANNELADYGADYGIEIGDEDVNDQSPDGNNHGDDADHNKGVPDVNEAGINIDTIIDTLIIPGKKWFQLLQVAYREPDWGLVEFACQRLFLPSEYRARGPIIRQLWMAMREDRFEELETVLRDKVIGHGTVPEATKELSRSWNVLDLATYLSIETTQGVGSERTLKAWPKLFF
ncbi:ankyrin repeat-containing domain protein [Nemania sp. FL0031]|nr:ankyrin repeat-containing domain protein [Nemania sp. FL0031]